MVSEWRTIPGFVHIGSTGKPRGIHGELKLFIDEAFLEDALQSEFLFVDRDGNKVPLEVESLREVQDILIKFSQVNDPSEASKWSGLNVFLPADEILTREPEEQVLHGFQNLKGYAITDKRLGDIGRILEVREFPQQEMAVLNYQHREVLVPLNPVFITTIDHQMKIVLMDLPEGLLEI